MPTMIWIALAVLGLALAGLAAVTWLLFHRAGRARSETSQRLHDAALRLDRRCDVLQQQVHTLDRRQRIGYLLDLVAQGESAGHWRGDVARRLRRFALELHAETFDPLS